MVHDLASALQAGDAVAVFPEGTTSSGETVLPFHATLLQAAVATQALVQPVLIRYLDASGERAEHVRYVDDDTLVRSIWRVLWAPHTVAKACLESCAQRPLKSGVRFSVNALRPSL